jgi:hypothetical protein
MDIVFLTSIFSKQNEMYRPIGPYQLAWWLREHNFNVQVIDYIHRFKMNELVAAAERYITPKTKILAFGAMFNKKESGAYLKMVELVIRELKRKHPQLIAICGGVNIENINSEFPGGRLFDYYFYGHSENTMLAFCKAIYSNGMMPTVESHYGNKVIREGSDSLIPSTKKFDIHGNSHLFNDQDFIQPGESLPIELSRGCIFSCKYCRYPYIGRKKNDYIRDFELIKEEMLHNYNKWGVTNYYLLDDTFNDNQVKLTAFIDMVKSLPFKITFSCYMRPDLLHAHQDSCVELSNIGLVSTFLGVETLNPDAAELVGKAWSGKHAKDWIPKLYHDVWKKKTTFRLGLILGLPPETVQDFHNTQQWCIDNEIPAWIWHSLSISRDTSNAWTSEFDRNAEKYGFEWYVKFGKVLWKTKYINAKDAYDLSLTLNANAKQHQKVHCWLLTELANYGYDLDAIKNRKQLTFEWNEVGQKRDTFFENYKRQVMGKDETAIKENRTEETRIIRPSFVE